MERIKSEIKNLIDEWWWGNSAEAKYRCEAYGELLEFINSLQEEPVSKDLEEASDNYVGHAPEIDEDLSCFTKRNAFIAGAKWGMEQTEVKIQAQSIAVAHGCPKEPVSNDLEKAAREIGQKYFPDKDNIWARPNYEAKKAECAFMEGAQWQKGNLWKNAQGDDLPEIDREVIVLYQPYQLEGSSECAVGFAHRPPERWYGRNLDGEEHVFEPKTYDKGEWNIPNVVWWLDLDLPIKEE